VSLIEQNLPSSLISSTIITPRTEVFFVLSSCAQRKEQAAVAAAAALWHNEAFLLLCPLFNLINNQHHMYMHVAEAVWVHRRRHLG
jgi:hypothetical protein